MKGFLSHSGTIAVYNVDHVDTDRVIPARFLTMVTKSGYGKLLFHDVRGADFPLDQKEALGATILVVGTNFGCGSSREHAVWAIQQAGFRCVIAKKTESTPGFSDIFRQNSANCGLLLIELKVEDHQALCDLGAGSTATVDLPAQTVTFADHVAAFEINENTKQALIQGLDLIGSSLALEDAIAAHEAKSEVFVPPYSGATSR